MLLKRVRAGCAERKVCGSDSFRRAILGPPRPRRIARRNRLTWDHHGGKPANPSGKSTAELRRFYRGELMPKPTVRNGGSVLHCLSQRAHQQRICDRTPKQSLRATAIVRAILLTLEKLPRTPRRGHCSHLFLRRFKKHVPFSLDVFRKCGEGIETRNQARGNSRRIGQAGRRWDKHMPQGTQIVRAKVLTCRIGSGGDLSDTAKSAAEIEALVAQLRPSLTQGHWGDKP